MLTIRLQRIGKKHQPSYRLVVAPARSKLGAPPTEDLGSYSPFSKETKLNAERVEHWIKAGAQPSLTVHNLLVKTGILTVPKKRIPMPKAVVKEAVVEEPKAESSSAKATEDKEVKAEEAAAETPAEAPKEEAAAE